MHQFFLTLHQVRSKVALFITFIMHVLGSIEQNMQSTGSAEGRQKGWVILLPFQIGARESGTRLRQEKIWKGTLYISMRRIRQHEMPCFCISETVVTSWRGSSTVTKENVTTRWSQTWRHRISGLPGYVYTSTHNISDLGRHMSITIPDFLGCTREKILLVGY